MIQLKASEWTVRTCDLAQASELVRRHHYSGSTANTAVGRHGLYRAADGILAAPCGAALWMPPTKPAAIRTLTDAGLEPSWWRQVLTLSRLVLEPDLPTNAASFLLGRSMRLLDRERWPVLVTYADTRLGHTGAIYQATNWHEVGEVPAGDVWVGPDGEQRGRKRGPNNLTVAEMRAAGFTRAPAAPKVKFIHVHRSARRWMAVAS